MSASHSILFRVDAHRQFGMGHIFRCIHLAVYLREHLGLQPLFCLLDHSLETGCAKNLEANGIEYKVVSGANRFKEDMGLTNDLIQSIQPRLIVTDLLSPDPGDADLWEDGKLVFESVSEYVGNLRVQGLKVVSITDEIDHIAIRPNVVLGASCHYPERDLQSAKGTEVYLGPDYYILSDDFREFAGRSKEIPDQARKILLIFGAAIMTCTH